MKKVSCRLCCALLLLVCNGMVAIAGDGVTIEALRNAQFKSSLKVEKLKYERELYKGELVSYISDGLKVYALLNTPKADMPKAGYPVVIFGHGFHPQPEKYGVTKDGDISRPGDYYRGIPESYAEKGFVVVTPDYRGHNVSEGFEFTKKSYLASSYYARDVLSLLSALENLPDIDLDRIYFQGHSMGVDVGLKVLLASNRIRAASLWSGVIASTPQQALYYGKSSLEKGAVVDSTAIASMRKKIDGIYEKLTPSSSFADVDPVNYIELLSTPLVIHHGLGDTGAPYLWSESFMSELNEHKKEAIFYFYDTDQHLFSGELRKKAVQRDIDFFNAK